MGYKRRIKKWEIEFPDAYFQVNTIIWKTFDDEIYSTNDTTTIVTWDKKVMCEALVGIYKDEQSRINRVAALDIIKIPFIYDTNSDKNLIVQAYEKLKSMEDFSGGIDV